LDIKKLITKVQQKDRKAEHRLFEHFGPRLFTVCRRDAFDDSQAKDYLQECFIHVFSKIHQFDTRQKGQFESWFYKVCINHILTKKRKKVKQITLEFREVLPDCLEEEELNLISDDELIAAIQKLPEGYRNVLNLKILEEYTHNEIAATLGITASTSRSQFKRAKEYLKKIIESQIIIQRNEVA